MTGFFWFCQRHGWLKENPAAGLSRVRVKDGPVTEYFTRDEFKKLVDGTYVYDQKRKDDSSDVLGTRLRTLLLLMRWSGLAIRDAVTLEREKLNEQDELVLRRAKTGVPVYVKLPPDVAIALRKVPPPGRNPIHDISSGAATANRRARLPTGNARFGSCLRLPI